MSQVLKCRGLVVSCRPQIIKDERVMNNGAVRFELWGPERTDWLNLERSVGVIGDQGKWTFEASGEPLPFEKPEKYKTKRIVDRFTPEMLEEYMAALGIRLFDPDFYGHEGMLINLPEPPVTNRGFRSRTLEEAQSFYGIG